jgi:hypothetical protein
MEIQNSFAAKMMRIGGYLNIIFSPLFAVFYQFIESFEGRTVPEDPFWLWSFYFCTSVFGFLYIKVSKNPIKYYSLIPITIFAKTWGVLTILYTLFAAYAFVPVAGLYDLIFLPFFIILYNKTRNYITLNKN